MEEHEAPPAAGSDDVGETSKRKRSRKAAGEAGKPKRTKPIPPPVADDEENPTHTVHAAEAPDPTDLTAKEMRDRKVEASTGRGRPSKTAMKQFRNLQRIQRERRKQEQLERASQRKPRKVERVATKEAPVVPVIRLPAQQRHAIEVEKIERDIVQAENAVLLNEADPTLSSQDRDANARKLLSEVQTMKLEREYYHKRFNEWVKKYNTAMATKGASIQMARENLPPGDIRRFVLISEEQHMQNIKRAMEKMFYLEVVREEVYEKPSNKFSVAKKKKKTIGQSVLQSNVNNCPSAKCKNCGGPVLIDEHLASASCMNCGRVGDMVHLDKVNFCDKDTYSKGTLPYEPLSHFKEFLSRLQGIERTEIPDAVINAVKMRCEMNRIDYVNDPSSLTYSRCRQFLQQEGFASRFENICQIIRRVTGVQPVSLSPDEIQQLTTIFMELGSCYPSFKGTRRNMLSYAYTTYKSCQLLRIDKALPFLPLFKDAANLAKADAIWKKICETKGYEYIESA